MPHDLTIQDYHFSVPTPEDCGIVPGATLDAGSARALYQLRNDKIRNNLAPVVKRMQAQGANIDAIADHVEQYARDYRFPGPVSDQDKAERAEVQRLAREIDKIARETVRQHLAEKGRKMTDVPQGMTADEWHKRLQDNIDRIAAHPDTAVLARKRIDEARAIAALARVDA